MEDKLPQPNVTPQSPAPLDRLPPAPRSTDVSGEQLLQVLQTAVHGYTKTLEVQHMQNERDFELRSRALELQRHVFDQSWKLDHYQFWWRAGLSLLILLFAAGLAFYSKEVAIALALLPTVVALLNWPMRRSSQQKESYEEKPRT
jgi:hypothetical protein